MILFPLKEGKAKKGEIADATAEQVKSDAASVQNRSKNIIDLPKTDKSVEFVTLTEEMKKHRAYQQLRQAEVDHKYARKRFRMAKYAESCKLAESEGRDKPKTKKQLRLKK